MAGLGERPGNLSENAKIGEEPRQRKAPQPGVLASGLYGRWEWGRAEWREWQSVRKREGQTVRRGVRDRRRQGKVVSAMALCRGLMPAKMSSHFLVPENLLVTSISVQR